MHVLREAAKRDDFDVMIIGGGPAGLSAAIWCSDLNLRAVLFDDGKSFGGQLGWTFNEIRNYPGIMSIGADELRRSFIDQAAAGSTSLVAERVVAAHLASKSAVLADGREFTARSVIIATGVRRRRLALPGEMELLGRGVLASGVGSRHDAAGRHIVIVGGGDAAVENALILGETAAAVTLVHRGETFRARAEFVDAAKRKQNIRFRLAAEVTSILGREKFEAVELIDRNTRKRSRIEADLLLIRIGTRPNTELFAGQVGMDADGFVRASADASTSVEHVYAVGDVAFPMAPTLSTAAGSAAIATKVISSLTHCT